MTDSGVAMTKTAVMEIALPLAGIMALWLGIMRLAEKAGLIQVAGPDGAAQRDEMAFPRGARRSSGDGPPC